MLRGVVVLTAVKLFKHYKDKANIYKYKHFAENIFFFCVFFFGRGFYLYIYASERGRLVSFLGCWVLGAGCSSANRRRIVAGVPRGGRSSSSRGAGRGQLEALGAQDVASWRPPGRRTWPAGGPRGGSTRVECYKLAQRANVQGWACANVQSLGRVQVCRCADICRGCVQMCKPTCANVQRFADIC